MNDQHKTKTQLLSELAALRQEVSHLRARHSEQAEEEPGVESIIFARALEGIHLDRVEDNVIVYTNPILEKMFGYDPGEMVGRHVSVLNAPIEKEPEETANDIETAVETYGSWQGEINNIKKDGTPIWCAASVSTLFHPRYGKVYFSINIDITRHKQMEEALRESEARFREMADLLPQVVCETDLKGNLTYVNRRGYSAFRYTPVEIEQGFSIFQAVSPENRARVQENMERILAGETSQGEEFNALRKDGSTFPVLVYSTPIIGHGQVCGIRYLIVDITERKLAQLQMVEAQKLASLGTLSAGLAHELNSPLQIITGVSESLQAYIRTDAIDPEHISQKLKLIQRNGWRCAEIVRSLLNYARPETGQIQPHDLNKLVTDALLLTKHQFQNWSNIALNTDLASNLPLLLCDANHISQVLINLLTNARDAMPEGGLITIQTALDAFTQRFILRVSDTGTGIPKMLRERIFDPFFSTKPIGTGIGLGLSMSNAIAHAYGGEIVVEEVFPHGSIFNVYFAMNGPRESTFSIPNDMGRYRDADQG